MGRRMANGWNGGFVEWTEGRTAYLSVVFSWQMQRAYQRAVWYRAQGYRVRAGGPAVTLNPACLADVAELGGQVEALTRHNPRATVTSRGCVRQCGFCAVPKIEGELVELTEWEPRPLVCDNNLLACSQAHFSRVITSLKHLPGVDFNQGLDARLLTDYHAERLAELDCLVRLSWDSTPSKPWVIHAVEKLRWAGFPLRRIRIYVLLGYEDSPADALFRLRTVQGLGLDPFPMRYQPLDSRARNSYVAPGWTNRELVRFMRYWSNLRYFGGVPFEEFE